MKTRAWLILGLLLVMSLSCNKDDKNDPITPPVTGEIKQPLNYDDPAVLPEVERKIEKLEGNFSPLLTGVIATWRIESKYNFSTSPFYDCWSNYVNTYYDAVTREQIKGKAITWAACALIYPNMTKTPDFSAPSISVWGQAQAGVEEIMEGNGDLSYIEGGTYKIAYHRYYTLPVLPEAYILMERKWEVVPIPGSGNYAMCEGCSSLTKSTSTMTGLKIDKTKEWGYTLGITYGADVTVPFGSFGSKVTAQFNQQFSTSIQNYEETETSITITGTLPAGKNIIRLQVFREVSTFKLVNQDGGEYFPGVYSPELAITTQTKNYIWYY